MSPANLVGRLLCACAVLVASVAACGAAAPPVSPEARAAWTPELSADAEARRAPRDDTRAPDGGADDSADLTPPKCPYGSIEDAHRGFVRCLAAEERDAGPPPPVAVAPTPEAPPVVEVGTPTFENGEVPRVEKVLNRAASDIATCIASHGGLTAETGNLKVQFLVRSRGRAEGVEIVSAKGVSTDARACVRKLLKNKAIGAPTAESRGRHRGLDVNACEVAEEGRPRARDLR